MKNKSSISRKRFPWHAAIAVFCVFFLGMSVSAFADQYNFYFSKPKKKSSKVNKEEIQKPEASDSDSDSEEPEAKTAKEETPPPTPPAPPLVAPAEVKKQSVDTQQQTFAYPVGPNGGQIPIIINNTNSITAPQSPATIITPPPVMVPEAKAPAPVDAGLVPPTPRESEVFLIPKDPGASKWKMGFSATVLFQDFQKTYNSSANSYGGSSYSYTSREATYGGLISLGYDLAKVLTLNLYGGARYAPTDGKGYYHAGADLELMPLRVSIKDKWDLFQLGILIGGSTAFAANDNIGTLHAGARLNINFGRNFGITACARANLGYVMLEGGLVARL